eukprot:TRINITY_DN1787_c0_g1_i2.p1 TRINITY_DN1787_c0_g1~~TRINITY_DN1787_c0_g1_i2.p1  ORF type:complete len:705 (+),score=101.92 TRINITY_DN1787_c0_g1_i2:63-2177(+)
MRRDLSENSMINTSRENMSSSAAESQAILRPFSHKTNHGVQMHQWKHSYSIVVLIVITPPLVLSLLFEGDKDDDISFYHIYGSIVSMMCCVFVYWGYFSIRRKGRNPNYVSSAPVLLLLSSISWDAIFSIVTIVDILHEDKNDCYVYSAITQFSMIASVLYIVSLSMDLLMTVQFSFMNHKALLPWYHTLVMMLSGASCVVLLVSEKYGDSIFQRCWVQKDVDNDGINEYNWILINIPFIICFVIVTFVLLIGYYRLENAKATRKSYNTSAKDNRLVAQLNAILKSQSIQTLIICTYYMIIAAIYSSMYLQDSTFPVNAQLKFLAAFIDMKAIPVVIVWQMRVPPQNVDDYQTLEEYTISKLAESRRLDIIQTCSACIKETAEMSAGPNHKIAGKAKYHDFESVLLLNVRGETSGVQFRFKSYAMRVFRHIREASGITTETYSNAFRPGRDMKERFSEGQSGSFLYFTEDGKYVVKTVSQEEKNSLLKILPHYYNHVIENPGSHLVRYVGVHAMSMYGPTTYMVVMRNVMPNARVRKYDLKGSIVGRSVYGRQINRPESQLGFVSRNLWSSGKDHMKSTQNTLKDAEFLEKEGKIHFPPNQADSFMKALRADVAFLTSMKVMDYSLLVGIPDFGTRNTGMYDSASRMSMSSVNSEDLGSRENPRIFTGIIDILQEYNHRKRLEHFFKTKYVCAWSLFTFDDMCI